MRIKKFLDKERIKDSCKRCGTTRSHSAKSETKKQVYWVATWKDNEDFVFINTKLEYTFMTFNHPEFPKFLTDKFDIYCTECFDDLYEGEEAGK